MDDARATELRAWLTLHLAPGMGAGRLVALLERCGTAGRVLSLGDAELAAVGLGAACRTFLRNPDAACLQQALDWADRPGHRLMILTDPDYPALLRAIPRPPPLLYVTGRAELLGEPQLAVVGSRNASGAGLKTAGMFARAFAESGLVVTSGLALGIDAAAHEAALAAAAPTIAVLGTGADIVYPARHRALAHRIAEAGALVTEFPLGTGARPEQFPQRNRIISGLATGVLVVEAAARSGSLGTARHALEQGREVFAIPGSIHNPLARGCHALIREGATLVEHTGHVFEQIGPLVGLSLAAVGPASPGPDAVRPPGEDLTAQQQLVLDCFDYGPASVDGLVGRARLTAPEVSSILLILELKGLVATQPGGVYCRL